MSGAPADLDPTALDARLNTTRFGRPCVVHAICGSTNDLAAAAAREGAAEGLVVLADRQESGRGQKGRRWLSAPGESLTFSLLLRPDCAAAALPPLTLMAGVAVAETLAARNLPARLKWPNDVLLETAAGPRKACGILTEMATVRDRVRHVVLGIGVNVNQAAFPDELATIATSLRQALGRPLARAELLADLLAALEQRYDDAIGAGASTFLPAWRAFAGLPRPCRIERTAGQPPLVGTAVDVEADGALLVDTGAATTRILSGELALL